MLVVLVGDMVTEEALPNYAISLNLIARDENGTNDDPWAKWMRGWTSEENRHGDLLNAYLRLTGRDGVVRVIVCDTGSGIERALLPHVFERFRQGDWRKAGVHGGLGLGLAIVREIVELHGGAVAVHSDGPGTGATFTVTLPMADSG